MSFRTASAVRNLLVQCQGCAPAGCSCPDPVIPTPRKVECIFEEQSRSSHCEVTEVTFGDMDDTVRNALTKMSRPHFACTRRAAENLEMKQYISRCPQVTFPAAAEVSEVRRQTTVSRDRIVEIGGIQSITLDQRAAPSPHGIAAPR